MGGRRGEWSLEAQSDGAGTMLADFHANRHATPNTGKTEDRQLGTGTGTWGVGVAKEKQRAVDAWNGGDEGFKGCEVRGR